MVAKQKCPPNKNSRQTKKAAKKKNGRQTKMVAKQKWSWEGFEVCNKNSVWGPQSFLVDLNGNPDPQEFFLVDLKDPARSAQSFLVDLFWPWPGFF